MSGATLGSRIQTARRDRGWRQKDLAQAVGVEPHTVSRWERDSNAPTVDTLARIAGALGKPIGYFVTEAVPVPAPSSENVPAGRLAALEGAFAELAMQVAELADRVADQLPPAHGRAESDSREAEEG